MQKFGEGEVGRDPEDPQGVPVTPENEGIQREGAAQGPQEAQRDLQQENDEADAAPGVYPEDTQNQG